MVSVNTGSGNDPNHHTAILRFLSHPRLQPILRLGGRGRPEVFRETGSCRHWLRKTTVDAESAFRFEKASVPKTDTATPFNGVLVTGSHRSGTTWVGKILAEAPETCYLHEPFKPGWHPPYAFASFPAISPPDRDNAGKHYERHWPRRSA